MNTIQFTNLIEFMPYFKDEAACTHYFEQIRFGTGNTAPIAATLKSTA